MPNSPGFERCLLHVVEAFLRGRGQPVIDGATADLLKKCFGKSPIELPTAWFAQK